MDQAGKIRVAVLYGGRSAEHEVSLRSAANVIQHLDASQYDVIPVGIDKMGNWFLGKDVFAKSLKDNCVSSEGYLEDRPAQTWFTAEWVGKPVKLQHAQDIVPTQATNRMFDVVFPVVHGTMCEDGTLQGLLELAELPFVGCGVLSSAVNMDKDISKRLAMQAGIPVAPYVVIKQDQWQIHQASCLARVDAQLSLPVFVKPANTGSSVGITKVKNKDELIPAIKEALRFDTKVLVEKALDVVELEVAVLEGLNPGDEPTVSVVGEIRPRHEFYSYEAKYLDDHGAELLVPATVSDEIRQQAQQIAKQLFVLLECEGMARVDLFYDKQAGQICFNEINTIPGFTKISMYPRLMEVSGVSYSQLLTHLIKLAIRRYNKKSRLVRTFENETTVSTSG